MTAEQAIALRLLLEDVQRAAVTDRARWECFCPHGWAGARLWAALEEAEAAPEPPTTNTEGATHGLHS